MRGDTSTGKPDRRGDRVLTCVDADPKAKLVCRPVANFERLDGVEQRQRRPGNLAGMQVTVTYRQAGHHHVRVTYRLNLQHHRRPRQPSSMATALDYSSVELLMTSRDYRGLTCDLALG